MGKMKTIGLIMTEDSKKNWEGEAGLGRYFLDRFNKANDSLHYQVLHGVTGPLPKIEDFSRFSAFVISGSHHSVNDPYQWVRNLEEFVRNVDKYNHEHAEYERIKLLGICYGHQLIAKALGGKVEAIKHPNKFIFGSETIELTEKICEKEWFKDVFGKQKKTFRMMQVHGEEVTVLPDNAIIVGHSETCQNEIAIYGDTILTFQGHPEFTVDVMEGISKRLANSNLTEKLIEEGRLSSQLGETDVMVKLATSFLKS